MNCPCCKSKLHVTHQDHYQDLGEHVSQPNRQPSLKDGYECLNSDCIAHKYSVTWIEDGEYFYDIQKDISYRQLKTELEAASGSKNLYAIGSWNYYYNKGLEGIKRYAKIFNVGKYRIEIEPKPKGYNYEVEEQYEPNLFNWKIAIWKYTDSEKCSMTIWNPFWKNVKYDINRFNENFDRWIETKKDSYRVDCMRNILGKNAYNETYRDVFTRLCVGIYAHIFNPSRVKMLLDNKN